MFKYFDATFFKFLFGFMILIILTFVVVIITIESQYANQPSSFQNKEIVK